MRIAGAGISGLIGGAWPQTARAGEGTDADLVVLNAKVYTVDPKTLKAEAFAVRSGRFAAVGNNAEIRSLIGKGTQTFDARQMPSVPGFIDCLNHAPGTTLLSETSVGNPYVVEFVTISIIVGKLRARARETPPGTLVEEYFLDDTKVKDNQQLNMHDLDEMSRDHPVVVRHRGGPHFVLQQQSLRDGGCKQEHAAPRRNLRSRREWRTERRVTDRATAAFNRAGKRRSFTETRSSSETVKRSPIFPSVRALRRNERAS